MTGNWHERFALKNAKLNVALGAPSDPVLLNAFNNNKQTIKQLEQKAFGILAKTTHSKTEPKYSVHPKKTGDSELIHFRHKPFTQVSPYALLLIC